MATVVRFSLVLAFLFILATVQAQKPKTTTAKAPAVQKFRPPKLTSQLGNHSDSAVVVVDEAVQLVLLPLKITDDKKNPYTISSYQVMYTRVGVIENEETGKETPTKNNVASLFRETPLPELWKKILTQQLKRGEEIFFFDIIAKDAQGRLMFAPDLKIKIK